MARSEGPCGSCFAASMGQGRGGWQGGGEGPPPGSIVIQGCTTMSKERGDTRYHKKVRKAARGADFLRVVGSVLRAAGGCAVGRGGLERKVAKGCFTYAWRGEEWTGLHVATPQGAPRSAERSVVLPPSATKARARFPDSPHAAASGPVAEFGRLRRRDRARGTPHPAPLRGATLSRKGRGVRARAGPALPAGSPCAIARACETPHCGRGGRCHAWSRRLAAWCKDIRL